MGASLGTLLWEQMEGSSTEHSGLRHLRISEGDTRATGDSPNHYPPGLAPSPANYLPDEPGSAFWEGPSYPVVGHLPGSKGLSGPWRASRAVGRCQESGGATLDSWVLVGASALAGFSSAWLHSATTWVDQKPR